MPEMTADQRRALRRSGFVVALLAIFVSSLYWIEWGGPSPMDELWNVVADHNYFPPADPKSRVQYFRNLEIAPSESIAYATCILCSITVRGGVGEVATYWGDITYASGTTLGGGQGTRANGGRITLAAGVHVWNGAVVHANGGDVIADPSLHMNPYWVHGSPQFFYPGQRSYPKEAVLRFVLLTMVAGVLGGWLVWGSFRARVEEAVRRPVRSALLGAVLFALAMTYLSGLSSLFLYIFPPLALVFLTLVPIAYSFAVAIGFAVAAERIGSLAGITHHFSARVAGVILLIALMLIPVAGLFVMTAVALVALGAGTGIRLGVRGKASPSSTR